ncbi:MAG TPA: hypothetical protein VNS62_08695, partial [Candidatus Udaeobacter sp.]|nr:hypothetical protein [Candidatus Udaeobacter sp.]
DPVPNWLRTRILPGAKIVRQGRTGLAVTQERTKMADQPEVMELQSGWRPVSKAELAQLRRLSERRRK